jgi:two-component system nitrogen regulation response regulator GlnG
MHDSDYTRRRFCRIASVTLLLCLTIIWQSDLHRISAQCIATNDTAGLSRYFPLPHRPGRELAGLEYGGVSREPLRMFLDAASNLPLIAVDRRSAAWRWSSVVGKSLRRSA